MFRASVVALAVLVAASSSFAAEGRGTAQDAQALVQKAIAYIKEVGPEKAYAAITGQDPRFIDRDLYISVSDFKSVPLAHGGNAKLVGKEMSETQDTDGVFYMKERSEKAKTQKSFWSDYKFTNPVSKKVEPKSTYCEVLEATLVCCGFYK